MIYIIYKQKLRFSAIIAVWMLLLTIIVPAQSFAALPATVTSDPAVLTEQNLNNAVLHVSVGGDSLVSENVYASNVSLINPPPGLTVASVVYHSSTLLDVTLSFDGTDFDTNITEFMVALNSAVMSSGMPLTTLPVTIQAIVESVPSTFNVNTTQDEPDSNPGDGICMTAGGNCSLRAAVMEANALPGAQTIIVPSGEIVTALNSDVADTNGSRGDYDITGDLSVIGAGEALTTINGKNPESGAVDRVFHVISGTHVTMQNMTITGGYAGGNNCGGGILNEGELFLDHITLSGNIAYCGGGAANSNGGQLQITDSRIAENGISDDPARQVQLGGGLYQDGAGSSLALFRTAVEQNHAYSGGGFYAAEGTATVKDNSTIDHNVADYYGGAFYLEGMFSTSSLTIDSSIIKDNIAGQDGGILYVADSVQSFGVTIQNSEISGNSCNNAGSDIVYNLSSKPIFLLNNYWGSVSGPEVSEIHGAARWAPWYEDAGRTVVNGPLKSLTLSPPGLMPDFYPEQTKYTLIVSAATASVSVTPSLFNGVTALTVNGAAATSDHAVSVQVQPGSNTITIVVTPTLGTPITYTVTVNRQKQFTVDSLEDDVDVEAGDGNCADSKGHCTLRAAIQEANASPDADTIVLGAGVYTTAIEGADEDLSATGDLDILQPITIQGAGMNKTKIDGGQLDRIFDVHGVPFTLSGVTLQHGLTPSYQSGGAIYFEYPEMSEEMTDLPAYMYNISDALITDNTSGADGGGIELDGGSLSLTNVTFTRNTANSAESYGGGLNTYEGAVSGAYVYFNNNSAGTGGGMYTDGTATITQAAFTNNTAAYIGGGLFADGTLILTDASFAGNNAEDGGGLYLGSYLPDKSIKNVTFEANHATYSGGGAYAEGPAQFTNATFAGNTAGGDGGGMTVASYLGKLESPVIPTSDSQAIPDFPSTGQVAVISSTFSGNEAVNGAALFSGGYLLVTNTILANSVNGSDCYGSIDSGGHNLIQNAGEACEITGVTTGNLTGDPKLGMLGDFGGFGKTFMLSPGSPAIDAGMLPPVSPTADEAAVVPDRPTDQRGIMRPQGAGPDIGSFETIYSDVDANKDNDTTLSELLSYMKSSGKGDLNGDGTVDNKDYELMLKQLLPRTIK